MKFTTSQQELNKALAFVSKAVTVRSTMPVLKGILLSIDETGTLTMTASDMDLSIEKKMEVSDSEPGAVVLPAKLFTEIVRKLPSESIEIALADHNNVSIRTSLSEFKIVGMPAEEFPDIGTVLENRKPIIEDSTAQGTVNWDTNKFLKSGVTYAFVVTVSSNLNSENYKQEISCALNSVNMGDNGNYYKLTSTFMGKCSKGDKLHITSYKNGGTWTLFATRAIFIPVS